MTGGRGGRGGGGMTWTLKGTASTRTKGMLRIGKVMDTPNGKSSHHMIIFFRYTKEIQFIQNLSVEAN